MSQKNCRNCKNTFFVTDIDQAFYAKIGVPEPSFCPMCRMQRRLAYRNDRTLYQDKSVISGKPMISMYNPNYGFVVYEQNEWWGAGWEGLDYGREYDFRQPFFEQYAALQKVVPRFNVFNRDTENCEYVNYAPHCKNCYLIFGSWFDENCYFGQTLFECQDSVDNLFLDKSELCYENIDGNENYHSFYCQNCSNTTDSWFCFDCKGVLNCIGCWNLRKKEYHILNKPVSKEEFEKEKVKFSSYNYVQEFRAKFDDLIRKEAIHKSSVGFNNENVSGDFIFNCKNAKYCFSAYRCQDVAFAGRTVEQKDSYDFEGGGKGELLYENMSNDFSYKAIGCTTCENLVESYYCDLCFNCEHCFGCVGLKKKKYCILNKQYTKEEYEMKMALIIAHLKKTEEWGEFPPIVLSPFSYNETMANEYFPLSKEQARAKGYKWKDEDASPISVTSIISAKELPDTIDEVKDSILDQAILCEVTKKPFRLIKSELEFYRKQGLSLPRRHPDQRHKDRFARRNPRCLWNRNCTKCLKQILSSYSPKRTGKIYCEACYLQAVY
ncbi:MAG: hypothetical protein UT36_C0008G0019 [Candidatus Peregrinibacteria bacterium GW2011_GWF2_39_17]|nr:MAG: hypothetical protein UT36_C0008G0019 [Candidatus Peregrinibacteria bacterium GW2011_GWF2_39_17]HCW32057.1 hypothetical protein [Candidatus Peregrinibacteria bacterium]